MASYTIDRMIASLASDYQVLTHSVTIAFVDHESSNRDWADSPEIRDAIIDAWDQVEATTNLSYSVRTDAENTDFIYFVSYSQGYFDLTNSTLGWHDFPGPEQQVGVFNAYWSETADLYGKGQFGYVTAAHEVGHGLGLGHPHDSGAGSALYRGDPFYDNSYVTVMSYNDLPDSLAFTFDYGHVTGFSPLDIYVLQSFYGVDRSYNSGNNLYYLSNHGGLPQMGTIYDTGGYDRLIATEIHDAVLDLRPFEVSNDSSLDQRSSYSSGPFAGYGGLQLASGTLIEEAQGLGGHDTIYGNLADNLIIGRGGGDLFYHLGGEDTFQGGGGSDRAVADLAAPIAIETASGYALVSDGGGLLFLESVEQITDGISGTTYNLVDISTSNLSRFESETEFDFNGDNQIDSFQGFDKIHDGESQANNLGLYSENGQLFIGPSNVRLDEGLPGSAIALSDERGRAFLENSLGGFQPIALAEGGPKHSILFESLSPGRSGFLYQVVRFDSASGIALDRRPITKDLFTAELEFQQDLNGDGKLGPVISQIWDARSSSGTKLLASANGQMLVDSAGANLGDTLSGGVQLLYDSRGGIFSDSDLRGSQPVALDDERATYDVLFVGSGRGGLSYALVSFDKASGLQQGRRPETVDGLQAELEFQQDLNSDGKLGPVITGLHDEEDPAGQVALYSERGNLLLDDPGSTLGDTLSSEALFLSDSRGAPLLLGSIRGGQPVALREMAESYQVLFEVSARGATSYQSLSFDKLTGLQQGKRPESLATYDAETLFDQDLNSDGIIGPVVEKVLDPMAEGAAVGLYEVSGRLFVSDANLSLGEKVPDNALYLTNKNGLPLSNRDLSKSDPVALAFDGEDYEILLQSARARRGVHSYQTLDFDDVTGQADPAGSQGISLENAERLFQIDLDGDFLIG